MSFPAQIGAHIGAALLIIGAVWLVWVVLRMLLKTRPGRHPGGGRVGRLARLARARKAGGVGAPPAADTVPDGGGLLPPPPSGTATAVLTPDCSSLPVDLTSEYWRANPTEPLAPSEVVRWKSITDHYEWADVRVVPGGEQG